MDTICLSSYAKINLFLEVTGKRSDGFHDLESVFVEIDLADRLAASPAPPGETTLICDTPALDVGGDNLVIRAARLLAREYDVPHGIRFHLEKRIPMGGGLGGGSSNAAAALRLASRVWNLSPGEETLLELGASLGSDVPFFLRGGTSLVRGRGEILHPLAAFPQDIEMGLALSDIHSDTAAAFRGLRPPSPERLRDAARFVRAMRAGDVAAMDAAAFNRFEETVFRALPALAAIRDRLAAAGVAAHLSGSGSALWFFGNAGEVEKRLEEDSAWAALAAKHRLRLAGTRAASGNCRL